MTAEQCKMLLIHAICAILKKCKDDKFRIVVLPEEYSVPSSAATKPIEEPELSEVLTESSMSSEEVTNVNTLWTREDYKIFTDFCLF